MFVSTGQGVFVGKMTEGVEHGKRHAVVLADILRGV